MKTITLKKEIDFKKYAFKRCKIIYCKGDNYLKGVEGIILPFTQEFGKKKILCSMIIDKEVSLKNGLEFEKGEIINFLKGDRIKIL